MIALGDHPDGVVLPVRAQPGARREGVQGEHNGALKVSVAAPPEDGKANQAILAVLRASLGLKRGQVELIAGPTSRDKRVLLRGVSRETVTAWLARTL